MLCPTKSPRSSDLLEGILETVRGFDIVTEIVSAAVGLACFSDQYPQAGRVALIRAWLGLQNVEVEALGKLQAYVPTRPEAFLDALEISEPSAGREDRQYILLDRLIEMRDHPNVRPMLGARLPLWLGRWSRQAQRILQGPDQFDWQTAREAQLSHAFEMLLPAERVLFNELCVEVQDSSLQWECGLLVCQRRFNQQYFDR